MCLELGCPFHLAFIVWGNLPPGLTHCVLVMPYGQIKWVNIGSGNGLVPDGTKPLPEPMLTYHQWGPVTFTWGYHHWICEISILDMSLKITDFKIQPHLPGASELIASLHSPLHGYNNCFLSILGEFWATQCASCLKYEISFRFEIWNQRWVQNDVFVLNHTMCFTFEIGNWWI